MTRDPWLVKAWDTVADWLFNADWWWWFVVLGTILLISAWILAVNVEQREWESYSGSHHCVVKGNEGGDVLPVFGNRNGGVIVTPRKTIYVCDGGEIVIR